MYPSTHAVTQNCLIEKTTAIPTLNSGENEEFHLYVGQGHRDWSMAENLRKARQVCSDAGLSSTAASDTPSQVR